MAEKTDSEIRAEEIEKDKAEIAKQEAEIKEKQEQLTQLQEKLDSGTLSDEEQKEALLEQEILQKVVDGKQEELDESKEELEKKEAAHEELNQIEEETAALEKEKAEAEAAGDTEAVAAIAGMLANLNTDKSDIFQDKKLGGIANLSEIQYIKPPDPDGDFSGSNYNDWPLAKFAFKVSLGGAVLNFQAMDGLGATIAKMEYRDGNSSKYYKQSRPTLTSFDPVTLKKGTYAGDSALFDWFKNVSQGAFFGDTKDVTITLCEYTAGGLEDMVTWTLEDAYITKFTPSGMDGEADSELAIEEIELTYQSFNMSSRGSIFGLIAGALGI